jgi:hypothetical protein
MGRALLVAAVVAVAAAVVAVAAAVVDEAGNARPDA